MTEITDDMVKKKHKEFNNEIKTLLGELQNKTVSNVNPVMQKLRQSAQTK